MVAPPDDVWDKYFSGRQVPARESFTVWSRLLNKWLVSGEGRVLEEGPFQATVQLRVLQDIRFGWGVLGASIHERTREVVAQDNDDLVLWLNLEGSFLARRAGREIELRPGDAYLMSCSERGALIQPSGGSQLCLRVRREALLPTVRDLDDRRGAFIPRGSDGMRLLAGYLRMVGTADPLTEGAVQSSVTRHVHELLALTLGPTHQEREQVQESLRAARLKAAKALIRRCAADPGLSADGVGQRLQISARSVQRLFESEGTTFSNFVIAERLARAHAALISSARLQTSVADIALDCGFRDISYFNRKFRERYHASPSEVRYRESVGL